MPHDAVDDWVDKALEAETLPIDIEDEDNEPVGPPPTESELDAAQRLLVQWRQMILAIRR